MHAGTEELERLAKVVGRHDGTYASHIRNRGETFVEAVQEAIGIAEAGGTRLLLSHLAPRPYATGEDTRRVHELIDAARERGLSVTIDTFPDAWGPSPLPSILPPWFTDGSWQDVARRLEEPSVIAAARAAFDQQDSRLLRTTPGHELRLSASRAHPEVVGKTLGEISTAWGLHLADVACRLLRDDGEDFYSVLIQHRYATDAALDDLYRNPMCAFESDGVVAALDGELSDMTMNRSTYGYTARVLGELVRDRGLFPIEEAVRRMTALPAAAAGLSDRGMLRPGSAADLVAFDPERITDMTTDVEIAALPEGIAHVVVNGRLAMRDGELLAERAGRMLRRNAFRDTPGLAVGAAQQR
jgi:N-acyl-D-aspartate/D-glutamate deacylase